MGLFDFLKRRAPKLDDDPMAIVPLVGGRVTSDANTGAALPRQTGRDADTFSKLRLIRDTVPDVSMAVWNMLRLGISEWELKVIDGKDADGALVINAELTDLMNEWMKDGIAKDYGKGLGNFMVVGFMSLVTCGAVATEVEVAPTLDSVVDWHLVNPEKIQARRLKADEPMPPGKYPNEIVFCCYDSQGKLTDLSDAQFRYIPVDPDVGDPYGRSPILPALHEVQFQIQLLADLKAVVHNQGYPRIDIEVLEEAVRNAAAPELHQPGREAELASFMLGKIGEIKTAVEALNPDDAFIHLDNLKVQYASPGGSLNFEAVEKIISGQIVTALKQLPILLGRNDSTTETHGTVQYRIFVKGIESLREKIADLVQFAADVTLRSWGYASKAVLEFEGIRHTDRLKESQADYTEHQTRKLAQDAGWIDGDEAAQDLYGHDASGEPVNNTPTVVVQNPQPDEAPEAPDEQPAPGDDAAPPEPPDVTGEKAADGVQDRLFDPDTRMTRKETMEYLKAWPVEDEVKRFVAAEMDKYNDEITLWLAEKAEEAAKVLDRMGQGRAGPPLAELQVHQYTHTFGDFMSEVNTKWGTEFKDMSLPYYQAVVSKTGRYFAKMAGVNVNFNLLDEKAMAYLEEKTPEFMNIAQHTAAGIMENVEAGFRNGLHPYEVAKSIREMDVVSPARAETIARTEMLDASNAGSYAAYEASGIVEEIRWVAQLDDRVCPICEELDDTVVALGEKFCTPEDPFGMPGEGVEEVAERPPAHPDCRCTTVVHTFRDFSEVLEEMKSQMPPDYSDTGMGGIGDNLGCSDPNFRFDPNSSLNVEEALAKGTNMEGRIDQTGYRYTNKRIDHADQAAREMAKKQIQNECYYDIRDKHIDQWLLAAKEHVYDINDLFAGYTGDMTDGAAVRDYLQNVPDGLHKWENAQKLTMRNWIHQWACTSANEDPVSLAFQRAFEEELGIQGAEWTHIDARISGTIRDRMTDLYEAQGDLMRAFARSHYENTQTWLEEMGYGADDRITLFRGMDNRAGVTLPQMVMDGARMTVTLQPANSTSIEYLTAREVFSEPAGTMTFFNVPREDIISGCRTGYGCLTEGEIILKGGQYEAVHINTGTLDNAIEALRVDIARGAVADVPPGGWSPERLAIEALKRLGVL